MNETRVFKLTRRPICPFCNQRTDRDAEVEALVKAAMHITKHAIEITKPWEMSDFKPSWGITHFAMQELTMAIEAFQDSNDPTAQDDVEG